MVDLLKQNYVRILIVGDSYVGKSSLLIQYTDNTFNDAYTSTIGYLCWRFAITHSGTGARVFEGATIEHTLFPFRVAAELTCDQRSSSTRVVNSTFSFGTLLAKSDSGR